MSEQITPPETTPEDEVTGVVIIHDLSDLSEGQAIVKKDIPELKSLKIEYPKT